MYGLKAVQALHTVGFILDAEIGGRCEICYKVVKQLSRPGGTAYTT